MYGQRTLFFSEYFSKNEEFELYPVAVLYNGFGLLVFCFWGPYFAIHIYIALYAYLAVYD